MKLTPEIYVGLGTPQQRLKAIVCGVFKIDEFIVDHRRQPEVIARMTYTNLLRDYTDMTLESIATAINRREHATVINAIKVLNNTMRNDPEYGPFVKECEEKAEEMFKNTTNEN